MDVKYSFNWKITADGKFIVRSCYDWFKEKLSSPSLSTNSVLALNHLWGVKVPSKILYFGWRDIFNRIATKDELLKKGYIGVIKLFISCVLCRGGRISKPHS